MVSHLQHVDVPEEGEGCRLHLGGHVPGEEDLDVAAGELGHHGAGVAVPPGIPGFQEGENGVVRQGEDPVLVVGEGAPLGLDGGPVVGIGFGVRGTAAVDDLPHRVGGQHLVQPADVVGVRVGGDEVVQGSVHIGGQIGRHRCAGAVVPAVDEDLGGAAVDEGGVPLAHVQEVDPDQGGPGGHHHLAGLPVPGDIGPEGLQHRADGEVGPVVSDLGGGVQVHPVAVDGHPGLADGDGHLHPVLLRPGGAAGVVPGDGAAEGLQRPPEGDLGRRCPGRGRRSRR